MFSKTTILRASHGLVLPLSSLLLIVFQVTNLIIDDNWQSLVSIEKQRNAEANFLRTMMGNPNSNVG